MITMYNTYIHRVCQPHFFNVLVWQKQKFESPQDTSIVQYTMDFSKIRSLHLFKNQILNNRISIIIKRGHHRYKKTIYTFLYVNIRLFVWMKSKPICHLRRTTISIDLVGLYIYINRRWWNAEYIIYNIGTRKVWKCIGNKHQRGFFIFFFVLYKTSVIMSVGLAFL